MRTEWFVRATNPRGLAGCVERHLRGLPLTGGPRVTRPAALGNR